VYDFRLLPAQCQSQTVFLHSTTPELVDRVATPTERRRYAASILRSRLLFAVKEAIYKAQYPSDGVFLDFHDIEVDLELNRAVTRSGRTFAISATPFPRVFALAFCPRDI
jgi:4'-phosphopantetheinyl transferase EntD